MRRHGAHDPILAALTRRDAAWLAAVLVAVATGLGAVIATEHTRAAASHARMRPAAARLSSAPVRPAAFGRPNIVFVLTDDLSWNLVRFMPTVQRMQRQGATFSRYFVTDSLCCPSRASILTGQFPHDTGVTTNTPPTGGWPIFQERGGESRTFATALRSAGYRTAMMGKYMNGYEPWSGYVPPGWSTWAVAGNGYRQFRYALDVNGDVKRYGHRPRAYLTDVLSDRGSAFIDRMADGQTPFMLEVATFAPHRPYTPAPRDRFALPGLQAPRGPAFDAATFDAPAWLAGHGPLSPEHLAQIDRDFRRRAQSVRSVDDLLARLWATLKERGIADNTYLVFSSDNGYHMGEHRLVSGKMTAFDTDIRVPLMVVGPGVAPGRRIRELTENVDLAPTFMQLGRARIPAAVDGRSLLGLLRGTSTRRWRDAVLVEHHNPGFSPLDPDIQTGPSGNPPSYEAIRTENATYVEYHDGEREYYDHGDDPDELFNLYEDLTPGEQASLHATLDRLVRCHHTAACWRAARR
jgi:N-acetylglucosamine-6-sulfatase